THTTCDHEVTVAEKNAVRMKLQGDSKVKTVRYVSKAEGLAEMKRKSPHIVEVLSALAILILLAAATILIGNTIRLSIFARRREIEVMKLVGASNWFV